MTGAITAAELAEIRRRLDAATPGPNAQSCEHEIDCPLCGEGCVPSVTVFMDRAYGIEVWGIGDDLAAGEAFWKNAHRDIARLLAEVDRLRTQNTELHRRCQQAESAVTEAMRQWEQHGGPRGGNFGRGVLAAENARLLAENGTLRRGIEAVETLIDESQGVYGLHRNGDLSPWSELRGPGRYCEWLQDFDDALSACTGSNEPGQVGGMP